MNLNDVLKFWFEDLTPAQWFEKDPTLDSAIAQRFTELLEKASRCELYTWRGSALGRLAEIIVLDQFSRNIYRNRPQAFANDNLSLALAQELVGTGLDGTLPIKQRAFAYMPYMHSESPAIHEVAMTLFGVDGLEENFKFEVAHKKIIDQFGRYPYRNKALGRESTLEESQFLKTRNGF